MAVTVSFDLTDEQWEITKEHFPLFMRETDDEVLTPERVGEIFFEYNKMWLRSGIKSTEGNLVHFDSLFNV